MRAACERCEALQPTDWSPGDLCVQCGEAVRHEVRCSWCATWTPVAKFCRTCGAEVVDELLYGVARMLKHAGVDQFTIPAKLASLDPDQRDNFSRIYQRQAVVVARHVEQLLFVQRHLRQQHWAAALEDELVAQLPWPDDELQRNSTVPVELVGDSPAVAAATARSIQETTPIDTTRGLAAVARLRLDDWTSFADAFDAFHSADATVRTEAALALTSWRVWLAVGPFDGVRPLIDELRVSPFVMEAAVRLAALTSDDITIPIDAADSDRETAVGVALVGGDIDRLRAALAGDELERAAAGAALAGLGLTDSLVQVLRVGPDFVRTHILQALSLARRPAPNLDTALLEIIEGTPDARLRELAARVAAPTLSTVGALRVVRAATGDRQIIQSVLQRSELPAEGVAEVLDLLIADGLFSLQQYGLSSVVDNDRLAASFVPSRFDDVDTDVRVELLGLAELQLKQRMDEDLHRFVMRIVFGSLPAEVRTAAWWALHRCYMHHGEHRGEGPMRLDVTSIDRFFGSVDVFLPCLTAVVRDRDALHEVAFADFAAALLGSADPELIIAMQAHRHDGGELVAALIEAVDGDRDDVDVRLNVNEAMIVLLSQISTAPQWRVEALAAIRRADRAGNFSVDRAIRRLELAEFGIPTEDLWDALPIDFVPQNFAAVSVVGQTEMLAVAEHQLIHCASGEPDLALLAFLATVAEQSPAESIRDRAAEIHRDRTPHGVPSFDRPDQ